MREHHLPASMSLATALASVRNGIHRMSSLEQDIVSPQKPPRRRRVLTLRRRVGNVALGAVSGGVAGWLAVLFAGVSGALPWWIIGALSALGAVFGYRFGRRVVAATFEALIDAAAD